MSRKQLTPESDRIARELWCKLRTMVDDVAPRITSGETVDIDLHIDGGCGLPYIDWHIRIKNDAEQIH